MNVRNQKKKKQHKKDQQHMKLLVTILGATALMNLAAFADNLTPVQVANGHGQIVVLYRTSAPSIAVSAGNSGIGSASATTLKAASKDNGHGQAVTLYRAE
jgi:hypothetical protein